MNKLVLKGVSYLFLSGLFAIFALVFFIKGSMFFTVFNIIFAVINYVRALEVLVQMNEEIS